MVQKVTAFPICADYRWRKSFWTSINKCSKKSTSQAINKKQPLAGSLTHHSITSHPDTPQHLDSDWYERWPPCLCWDYGGGEKQVGSWYECKERNRGPFQVVFQFELCNFISVTVCYSYISSLVPEMSARFSPCWAAWSLSDWFVWERSMEVVVFLRILCMHCIWKALNVLGLVLFVLVWQLWICCLQTWLTWLKWNDTQRPDTLVQCQIVERTDPTYFQHHLPNLDRNFLPLHIRTDDLISHSEFT